MAITKTWATGYQVILQKTVNSQSASSNTSNVTVSVKLKSLGSSWTINSSVSKNGSVTINGKTYDFTFTASLSGNQTKTIYTKTVNVTHDADGTKDLSMSCSLAVNVTIGGAYQSNWTASGSEALTTIPRASTLSAISNFTLGNAISVTIAKKNTAYYDTLVLKIGSTTIKTIAGISNGTTSVSLTATELANVYKALPSATKGTMTFTLTTKTSSSGSTVGSASRTATATIPSSVKPTISGVALTENVSGLAAQFGAFIQGKSKLKGVISASAGSGSSIATYKTVINGTTYSESDGTFYTGVLKTSGSNSYTVTVTDKRGRTASYTGTFNVTAYTVPVASTLTVKRCTYDGTTYTEDDDGTYAKVTVKASIASLGNKNTKTFALGYRVAGSTGDYTNVSLSQSAYSLSQTVYVADMSVDDAYEFRLTVEDFFVTETKYATLSTSYTLINFNADGTGMAIGGVSTMSNAFEVKTAQMTLPRMSYMGGIKSDNTEKNIYFQSTDDAEFPHNCKLYGGNGTSDTSIGMWDSARNKQIYRYQTRDQTFHFGADVALFQNGDPILLGILNSIGDNVGQYQLSDGLLLQWGKVSITPASANVAEKLTVTFKKSYSEKPNVFVIPQTSAPQNMSFGVGQGSTTVNAFDIYLTRTTTTATSMQWVAVGKA